MREKRRGVLEGREGAGCLAGTSTDDPRDDANRRINPHDIAEGERRREEEATATAPKEKQR